MRVGNIEIENTSFEKLLGIIVDSKRNFEEHLEGIIKKASWKLNVLPRITPYVNQKLIVNLFFTSQFNHCPLV